MKTKSLKAKNMYFKITVLKPRNSMCPFSWFWLVDISWRKASGKRMDAKILIDVKIQTDAKNSHYSGGGLLFFIWIMHINDFHDNLPKNLFQHRFGCSRFHCYRLQACRRLRHRIVQVLNITMVILSFNWLENIFWTYRPKYIFCTTLNNDFVSITLTLTAFTRCLNKEEIPP